MVLQIDANEHSCNSLVCFCVLSDFTDGKCPFHYAVKRANVLPVLCDSGYLSYRYPMDVQPSMPLPVTVVLTCSVFDNARSKVNVMLCVCVRERERDGIPWLVL